jgi:hypothetical protein
MPIAYQEQAQLTCPACGADFEAPVWLILDAQEQPAAAEALRRGELNTVACPACGNSGPAGAPLLYHDGAARRVIFAPAPGAAEHEIRDQARELHALLVGSIPEDQRRPYLADVDIAQDLAGVAHLLRRLDRRRKPAEPPAPAAEGAPSMPAPAAPGAAGPPPADETPPLLRAVEAMLAADTPEELDRALAANPILLDPATDATLAQLAEVATEQRAYAIAESLRSARAILARMDPAPRPAAPDGPLSAVPEPALQALLQAASSEELAAVAAIHPLLLRPEADALLAERVNLALDEGNERAAQAIEERREALAELRAVLAAPPADEPTLDEAIEALLIAEGEDALAEVIDRYPVLLDEVAGQALMQFAAEARASDDEELARYAVECREMLRRVREGLG